MKLSDLGKTKETTSTGVVHANKDSSGKYSVRSGGRNVRAKLIGSELPDMNSKVVIIESGGEQFIIAAKELRKSLTRKYVING